MTSDLRTPPSSSASSDRPPRRVRRRFWIPLAIAAAIALIISVIGVVLLSGGGNQAGSGNQNGSGNQAASTTVPQQANSAGDGNSGNENSGASQAPAVQTAPLPPPAGFSAEKALDWRLTQWDAFVFDGNAVDASGQPAFNPPSLNQTTAEWVDYVRSFIHVFPGQTGNGTVADQMLYGQPWAADGVLADVHSVLYPVVRGGVISVGDISVINADQDLGLPTRYALVGIKAPGATTWTNTMVRMDWRRASDDVPHIQLTVCNGPSDKC